MQFLKTLFITSATLALGALSLTAQPLPVDRQIKTGTLDNGLTYYIRHNANPAGVADFYIVHNVGALQEEDNQNGLAHFLEHMAFNGIKHFPDKQMLEFLGRNGVRFGANVNAFTSKSETCYHIDKAPVARESFVDSLLLILHDWSGDILCEQDELDNERGVIREEWRRGFDSRRTLFTSQTNLVYQGSKQTKRTVLGSLDVINNFKREDILDFYHKWYRPDLQAIIVVGDIDADKMEQKIISKFSDIPKAVNPTPKEVYRAPEANGPIFENLIDSTLSFSALKIFYRMPYPDREVRSTEEFYKDLYIRDILANVMTERMKEQIRSGKEAPKSAVMVNYSEAKDYYVDLYTILGRKDARMIDLIDFYAQNEKSMIEYGISYDELETSKALVKRRYHLERPKSEASLTNEDFVGVCHNNFVSGDALSNPAVMHEIQNRIIKEISLEDVKPYIRKVFVESDKIYSWFANPKDKGKVPSMEETKARLQEARAKDVKPNYLTLNKIDLTVNASEGSIVKERAVKGLEGTREWILSNGAKVYWTAVKEDVKATPDLSMIIYFDTGCNALPQDKLGSALFAGEFIKADAGFSGATNGEIGKDPDCSEITRSLRIGGNFASLLTNAPEKKAENAFRMAALTVTNPYFPQGKALEQMKDKKLESLSEPKKDAARFNQASDSLIYGKHPWSIDIDSTDVEGVSMDLVKEVYSKAFNPSAGMTIYIASNIGEERIKEYVRKYIASIPAGEKVGKKAKVKGRVPVFKGRQEFSMTGKKEINPFTVVARLFSSKVKPTAENLAAVDFTDYILSQRLLYQIREQRGGTYSIRFNSSVSIKDKGRSESEITFKTRPDLYRVLVGDLDDVVSVFCTEGPTTKELEEARKWLVKNERESQARKSKVMTHLNSKVVNYVRNGVDPNMDLVSAYESITAEDVRKVAEKLTSGNILTTIYTEE